MEQFRTQAGLISTAILAIANAIAGFGVAIDAEWLALGNAAALGIAAIVMHYTKNKGRDDFTANP